MNLTQRLGKITVFGRALTIKTNSGSCQWLKMRFEFIDCRIRIELKGLRPNWKAGIVEYWVIRKW